MIFDESFTLSNGITIPRLALGTWLIEDGIVSDAVQNAVKIGYRHIDTAQAYENERGVGEGIRKSGIPREQIFVTSKVAAELKSYEAAAASIDKSLMTSGLDYFDLMIIHCPQPWSEYHRADCPYRYPEENRQVWKALEEACQAGKIKAIGVSNFLECDIENILTDCKIKPMVNQILINITNTPAELISYCQKQNIITEAYSPIAHGAALNNPVLAAAAEAYGVSIPQLCIRYAWQLDLVVLPKTANPEHMKNNADLNFVISDSDMQILKNFDKISPGQIPAFSGN